MLALPPAAGKVIPSEIMSHPRPTIAVVIPVYNEEPVLPELLSRLAAVFDAQQDYHWQAFLVDDGSRDRSAELIRAQSVGDARFQLVQLSRNFGFQNALSAGQMGATRSSQSL